MKKSIFFIVLLLIFSLQQSLERLKEAQQGYSEAFSNYKEVRQSSDKAQIDKALEVLSATNNKKVLAILAPVIIGGAIVLIISIGIIRVSKKEESDVA